MSDGETSVFEFERGDGNERVYVISSGNDKDPALLSAFLNTVPDVCEKYEAYYLDTLSFQTKVKKLSEYNSISASA